MDEKTTARAPAAPPAPPPAASAPPAVPSQPSVDIERFSRNIARMVEEGGKALAAYLRPREDGTIKIEPADEISDMVKTFGHVAEYWLSDPQRATEIQTTLGKAYLELWAAAAKRLSGENVPPVIAPDPRDKRFHRSGMVLEPVLRLHQAGLSAQYAMGRAPGEERARPRPAYPPEGRVLHPAARECGLALQFPADQSRVDARHAERERRESGARHEDAGGGHRGGPGLSQAAPVGRVEVRGRREPRHDARQGDPSERPDAADPVFAGDRDGADAAAADHPAVDQQVLHPRPQPGEVVHQVVRRSGPHRVRDLVGQSRRAPGRQGLRGIHARGAARGPRRDQGRDRRGFRPRRSAIASAAR